MAAWLLNNVNISFFSRTQKVPFRCSIFFILFGICAPYWMWLNKNKKRENKSCTVVGIYRLLGLAEGMGKIFLWQLTKLLKRHIIVTTEYSNTLTSVGNWILPSWIANKFLSSLADSFICQTWMKEYWDLLPWTYSLPIERTWLKKWMWIESLEEVTI